MLHVGDTELTEFLQARFPEPLATVFPAWLDTRPLKDPDAAIRYAINHPHGSEPLYAKLRPGMSVTIAVDDINLMKG